MDDGGVVLHENEDVLWPAATGQWSREASSYPPLHCHQLRTWMIPSPPPPPHGWPATSSWPGEVQVCGRTCRRCCACSGWTPHLELPPETVVFALFSNRLDSVSQQCKTQKVSELPVSQGFGCTSITVDEETAFPDLVDKASLGAIFTSWYVYSLDELASNSMEEYLYAARAQKCESLIFSSVIWLVSMYVFSIDVFKLYICSFYFWMHYSSSCSYDGNSALSCRV